MNDLYQTDLMIEPLARLYSSLETQKLNSDNLAEQILIMELQLDLLKLQLQVKTIAQLGTCPQALTLTENLRRRILLFNKRCDDVFKQALFSDSKQVAPQALDLLLVRLNQHIDLIKHTVKL